MAGHNFLKALERKLRLGRWSVIFMLSLLSVDFFNGGETRADLKCEGERAFGER